jgi:hypothetical protein
MLLFEAMTFLGSAGQTPFLNTLHTTLKCSFKGTVPQDFRLQVCAAKAFCYCPAIINGFPYTGNIFTFKISDTAHKNFTLKIKLIIQIRNILWQKFAYYLH